MKKLSILFAFIFVVVVLDINAMQMDEKGAKSIKGGIVNLNNFITECF